MEWLIGGFVTMCGIYTIACAFVTFEIRKNIYHEIMLKDAYGDSSSTQFMLTLCLLESLDNVSFFKHTWYLMTFRNPRILYNQYLREFY